MRRLSLALSIVLALAAPGCTVLFGNDFHVGDAGTSHDDGGSTDAATDTGTDDAGHDVPDTGVDGGPVGCTAPSGTVRGTAMLRFLSATTETPQPIDMTTWVIRAVVGGVSHDGTGHADGTFEITGVPDGMTYALERIAPSGQTTIDFTDLRCVDIDVYVGGRPDAASVTVAQPMHLQLTNMQPWRNHDWIITEVFNTSTEGWQVDTIFDSPVAPGATSIDASYDFGDLTFNYSYRPGSRPALIDYGAGDALQIAHARRSDVLDASSGRLIQTFGAIDVADVAGPITMTAGTPTTAMGTFAPITPSSTLRFGINRAMYDAAYDAQSRFFDISMSMYGSPSANHGIGVGIPLADANFDDWSGTSARSLSVDLRFADPLPAAWPRIVDQRYTRRRFYRIPGTTQHGFWSFLIARQLAFTPGMAIPSTPDLLPPPNVQVAGVAGATGGTVHFDGTNPITLTWNPVAAANYYVVRVVRLFADGTVTNVSGAGALRTHATTVDVPPELFSGGEFFFFVVESVRDGGTWAAGHLELQPFPATFASTVTGRFHLLPSCGDGHTDAGEACDPGTTATATCNVDCTVSLCGDGIVNTLAGEECDGAGGMPSCTGTCHLPVCGDHLVSLETEDCDDGNTTDDGNGCTADCHRDNTCGNGIVEGTVEDCDDGNTTDDGNGCNVNCTANNVCGNHIAELAMEDCDTGGDTMSCDGDCTTVMCGDGYVNGAAGEQCDPPDGTACSATCRTI